MKADYKREEAVVVAAEILAALRSSCERLEIAGSVRRGKAAVHDVELVSGSEAAAV